MYFYDSAYMNFRVSYFTKAFLSTKPNNMLHYLMYVGNLGIHYSYNINGRNVLHKTICPIKRK